jgi:hypothetical protein
VASNRCGRAEVTANLTTIGKADAEFKSKAWTSIQQLESSKTVVSSQQLSFASQVSVASNFFPSTLTTRPRAFVLGNPFQSGLRI